MRVLRWAVLAAWVLVLALGSAFTGGLEEIETNDVRVWLPATAESTRALDVAEAHFTAEAPENLLIIYARSPLAPGDAEAVEDDRAALGSLAAESIPPPVPAAGGGALLLLVPLDQARLTEEALPGVLDRVRAIVAEGLPAGLDARLTGGPAASADFDAAFDSLDVTLLVVTVAVVAVLLLFTYRSPVLLVLALISVGAANLLATALVSLLATRAGLVVDSAGAGILTVLVFGAGTDYALLIISRYREERDIRRALRASLPAIAASAVTVILALLTLLFAEMNSTRGLGPVAAIGIASAFVAMTTLLPALLVLVGRWAFWPQRPARQRRIPLRRPVWMVTALALAGLAFVATGISTAQSREDAFVAKPDSVKGFELLAAHYPAGSGGPAVVYAPSARLDAVTGAVQQVPGVVSLKAPERSGEWARFEVTLADDPSGAQARETIKRMRQAAPSALIGGETAERVDQDAAMDTDLRLIVPLILLVVLAVLIVLLRCLVLPIVLLASVVLSFGAALGASLIIFRALGFPDVEKTVLLNGFLFLVALGVDYTIFLMTRAREEVARHGHAPGITRALAITGGVITSAGLVLAATFSVLALMPIVFMMQLGILVAVGVLLDTFVVRTLLVPGLALEIGPRIWWPSRLSSHLGRETPD